MFVWHVSKMSEYFEVVCGTSEVCEVSRDVESTRLLVDVNTVDVGRWVLLLFEALVLETADKVRVEVELFSLLLLMLLTFSGRL